MKLLHVGCADKYFDGFINSDMRTHWKGSKHKLDEVMDMSQPWPYEDNSIDGIVGMHVFQQLYWRDLIFAFKEAYRVLKPGGVLRMGFPMAEMTDKPVEWMLGWNNVNLFSEDLLYSVLVIHLGFDCFVRQKYRDSHMSELAVVDNRPNRCTRYFEAIK